MTKFMINYRTDAWKTDFNLLNSWRFSYYSAPIHSLVHGHMTSNNETVSRQMSWAGDIAKTMTSNGNQFTVTREMLTAVARDQRLPGVVTGISTRFSKFAFVLFCYITNQWLVPQGTVNFVSLESQCFILASSSEWKPVADLGGRIPEGPPPQPVTQPKAWIHHCKTYNSTKE